MTNWLTFFSRVQREFGQIIIATFHDSLFPIGIGPDLLPYRLDSLIEPAAGRAHELAVFEIVYGVKLFHHAPFFSRHLKLVFGGLFSVPTVNRLFFQQFYLADPLLTALFSDTLTLKWIARA